MVRKEGGGLHVYQTPAEGTRTAIDTDNSAANGGNVVGSLTGALDRYDPTGALSDPPAVSGAGSEVCTTTVTDIGAWKSGAGPKAMNVEPEDCGHTPSHTNGETEVTEGTADQLNGQPSRADTVQHVNTTRHGHGVNPTVAEAEHVPQRPDATGDTPAPGQEEHQLVWLSSTVHREDLGEGPTTKAREMPENGILSAESSADLDIVRNDTSIRHKHGANPMAEDAGQVPQRPAASGDAPMPGPDDTTFAWFQRTASRDLREAGSAQRTRNQLVSSSPPSGSSEGSYVHKTLVQDAVAWKPNAGPNAADVEPEEVGHTPRTSNGDSDVPKGPTYPRNAQLSQEASAPTHGQDAEDLERFKRTAGRTVLEVRPAKRARNPPKEMQHREVGVRYVVHRKGGENMPCRAKGSHGNSSTPHQQDDTVDALKRVQAKRKAAENDGDLAAAGNLSNPTARRRYSSGPGCGAPCAARSGKRGATADDALGKRHLHSPSRLIKRRRGPGVAVTGPHSDVGCGAPDVPVPAVDAAPDARLGGRGWHTRWPPPALATKGHRQASLRECLLRPPAAPDPAPFGSGRDAAFADC